MSTWYTLTFPTLKDIERRDGKKAVREHPRGTIARDQWFASKHLGVTFLVTEEEIRRLVIGTKKDVHGLFLGDKGICIEGDYYNEQVLKYCKGTAVKKAKEVKPTLNVDSLAYEIVWDGHFFRVGCQSIMPEDMQEIARWSAAQIIKSKRKKEA